MAHQTKKQTYYQYLNQFNPDKYTRHYQKKNQTNYKTMLTIFQQILELYSLWRLDPDNTDYSPDKFKPTEVSDYLYNIKKDKKKKNNGKDDTYYCINHQNESYLVNDNKLESLLLSKLSQHVLTLFQDKKKLDPQFVSKLYQSLNNASQIVTLLLDNDNNQSIVSKMLQTLLTTNPTSAINPSKPRMDYKIDENVVRNVIREDIIFNVNVAIIDIHNNVSKELPIKQKVICTLCHGTGMVETSPFQKRVCHRCHGYIQEVKEKVFPLDIRKRKIIYPKEGHQGLNMEQGDLIINIYPKATDNYRVINNYDLETYVDLDFIELYTQFEFYLPYITGNFCHIKFAPRHLSPADQKKFRHRKQLRVRDKGLPIEDTNRRGDLYIKFRVELPDMTLEDLAQLEMIPSLKSTRQVIVPVSTPEGEVISSGSLAIEPYYDSNE